MKRSWLTLVATVIVLTQAPCALAEDAVKDKAKEHFTKGKELVEEGALKQGIVEFKASYDLKPVPIVLYNIAVCYDQLNEYADALEYYEKFLAVADSAQKDFVAEVKTRVEKLETFVGTLVLDLDEEGVEVLVDGTVEGQSPLGPLVVAVGEHTLTLRVAGRADVNKSFTIVGGETTSMAVDLPTSKPAQPVGEDPPKDVDGGGATAQPGDGGAGEGPGEGTEGPGDAGKPEAKKAKKLGKAPFIAVAGGAGALLVGAVITGALALGAEKDFEKQYVEDEDEWKPLRDKANKLALATDILIGVGAAAAVSAVVLVFFTDFKGEKKADGKVEVSVAPVLGPDTTGVSLAVHY